MRRARALHGSEIQVEQGLLFVALVLVLLAQAQDFLEDFHVEALSLGLFEDFLLALVQRLDLFVDAFNALDEGANAIARDSLPRWSCLLSLQEAHTYAAKVTEGLTREIEALANSPGDDNMIGHWQFQTGFRLSAEDLPVRRSATTS